MLDRDAWDLTDPTQQTLHSTQTARLLTASIFPNFQELARTANELLTGLAFSSHNAKLSGARIGAGFAQQNVRSTLRKNRGSLGVRLNAWLWRTALDAFVRTPCDLTPNFLR